jgi:hypothetical protein
VLHQQDVEELLGKRPFEEKRIFAADEGDEGADNETGVAPSGEDAATATTETPATDPATAAEADTRADQAAPEAKP